jgi:hypothetical protein
MRRRSAHDILHIAYLTCARESKKQWDTADCAAVLLACIDRYLQVGEEEYKTIGYRGLKHLEEVMNREENNGR